MTGTSSSVSTKELTTPPITTRDIYVADCIPGDLKQIERVIMMPMLKLHHPPTRRRATSRTHVHYPFKHEPLDPHEILKQIAVCLGVVAVGILELYIIVEMFNSLLTN